MFDFTLALNDAVLPVQLPNDSMPSVGQADDPNNPGVPKPPKGIFLSALGIGQLPNDSMPSVGQADDPNNPSVPKPSK